MQTTPLYALPYVEPADAIADYPAVSEQLADTLEAKIAATARPPFLTALPAGPVVDGTEVYWIPDPAVLWFVVWHMVARAGNWWFLGGAPLLNEVGVAAPETTTSTAYTDLATVGPALTVPKAGQYDVAWGAAMNHSAAAGAALMSIRRGVTAAADVDAVRGSGGTSLIGVSRHRWFGSLGAGIQLKAEYKAVTAGTVTARDRWLAITPSVLPV